MNGRVYDPYLGRFISADTLISSLGATQSINPYSYAWNDPLRYIDPSGHGFLDALIGIVVGIVALVTLQPELIWALGTFWGTVTAAAIAGFVGGFTGALLATGSLSAALTAGLISGVTAAAFAAVGAWAQGGNWGIGERVLAHAAVGCGSAVLSGGNCGRGALAAAVSEAANQSGLLGPPPKSLASWGTVKGTAEAGLIGGVAAEITGGKFNDGFSVAAAGYLFNSVLHPGMQVRGPGSDRYNKRLVDDALAYIQRDPQASGVIEQANNEGVTININYDQVDNSVIGAHSVNWDPSEAVQTTDGRNISPAMALYHEIVHSLGDPSVSLQLDDFYKNSEEYRVITYFENPAALVLGEGLRYGHYGDPFHVGCVTCRAQ